MIQIQFKGECISELRDKITVLCQGFIPTLQEMVFVSIQL